MTQLASFKQWLLEPIKASFFSTIHLSLLFFIISVFFVLMLTRRTKSKPNLPPSPPKLPIIGNLHLLGTLPHRSLRDLSQKYGAMMMLQLGQRNTPTLVVSSADTAREIMKSHDLAFSNRPHNTASKILSYGCIDVAFVSYGANWRHKRKIFALELLSAKRVRSFRRVREEEVAELVNEVRKVSLSGACSVNLSEMLISTSYNILCKCALGRKYNTEEDRDIKIKELVTRKLVAHLTTFSVRDYFPLLGWVDVLSRQIQEFKATFRALDALFEQVIAERKTRKREANHDSDKEDFVDILLHLQERGIELAKDDLKALLMNMFLAGIDTSAATMEWAMVELVRKPFIIKKAQEEVRQVVGLRSNVEENDINQMDYLKCVVRETLRLHPPAPLVPRETRSSVKLKGYDIPEKTMVHINAWAIQRDPEFWERPEEFLPERHESSQIDFKGQDSQYIPFGFGRRGCPGMTFGLASTEYLLANLLYWFDWKLPHEAQDMDMSETFGLVVSKKVPLHLKPIPFSFGSKF